MNNGKNRNSMFIVFTGFIIALCRVLLGNINTITNDDQHILIIMAVVNFIALGFVLLFLYNDFCSICKEKISNSLMDGTTQRKCNLVLTVISLILLIAYLVVGCLYTIKLKTADLNDVLSIIALAISIATNGLVEEYNVTFYKIVKSIAKFKIQSGKNSKQN